MWEGFVAVGALRPLHPLDGPAALTLETAIEIEVVTHAKWHVVVPTAPAGGAATGQHAGKEWSLTTNPTIKRRELIDEQAATLGHAQASPIKEIGKGSVTLGVAAAPRRRAPVCSPMRTCGRK